MKTMSIVINSPKDSFVNLFEKCLHIYVTYLVIYHFSYLGVGILLM